MWFAGKGHGIGLLAAALLAIALPIQSAPAQTPAPTPNLLERLAGPETPADIDAAALRQQVADRVQSRADAPAVRRPPIAPQLLKLKHLDFNVVFDPDTSIIRPQSYQLIGRIADAMSDPKLLPYAFLVVNHTASGGNRAANLTLSQKRADAIRAILAGSFKISARRLHALGLGEEQLQDAARPVSEANVRTQIMTVGLVPPPAQPATSSTPPAKKGPAAKKRQ